MKISKSYFTRIVQKIVLLSRLDFLAKWFFFMRSFRKFKRSIHNKKNFNLFSNYNLNEINKYEYKISSQNNEDGIIDYIFNIIPNNKFFCEIGFGYYEFNSLNLIRKGWSGKVIDIDKIECITLKSNLSFFFPKAKVKIINSKVTKDNIENLVYQKNENKIIDFFSIDIDGNDYWVLKNLDLNSINIICCEYNNWLGNDKITMKYIEDKEFKDDGIFGASLSAITELLNLKDFYLIGVESSGTNAFFVNKRFKDKFKIFSPADCYKSVNRFYSEERKRTIFKNVKNSKLLQYL